MMLDHYIADEANAIRDAVQKTVDNNVGTLIYALIKALQLQK